MKKQTPKQQQKTNNLVVKQFAKRIRRQKKKAEARKGAATS